MIPVVLQQLERLQRELAAIDPDHDIEAAAQVAAIVTSLKESEPTARAPESDGVPYAPARRVA